MKNAFLARILQFYCGVFVFLSILSVYACMFLCECRSLLGQALSVSLRVLNLPSFSVCACTFVKCVRQY